MSSTGYIEVFALANWKNLSNCYPPLIPTERDKVKTLFVKRKVTFVLKYSSSPSISIRPVISESGQLFWWSPIKNAIEIRSSSKIMYIPMSWGVGFIFTFYIYVNVKITIDYTYYRTGYLWWIQSFSFTRTQILNLRNAQEWHQTTRLNLSLIISDFEIIWHVFV